MHKGHFLILIVQKYPVFSFILLSLFNHEPTSSCHTHDYFHFGTDCTRHKAAGTVLVFQQIEWCFSQFSFPSCSTRTSGSVTITAVALRGFL